MKYLITLLSLLVTASAAFANTPGKHTVLLGWTEAGCPTCTFNVYRSSSGNACNGIANPVPLATGISTTTWTDLNPPTASAVNYAFTAVSSGGESGCSVELQLSVPPDNTPIPTGPTGTVQ